MVLGQKRDLGQRGSGGPCLARNKAILNFHFTTWCLNDAELQEDLDVGLFRCPFVFQERKEGKAHYHAILYHSAQTIYQFQSTKVLHRPQTCLGFASHCSRRETFEDKS